jgi:Kdo2-lipid IVA lauroyltransferase/acyltransferase
MFFFRLLSRLPFFWLYRLADGLYLLLTYIVRYRRRVIDQNLSRAFPDRSLTDRRQLARGFYRNMADVLVETLKLLTMPADDMRRRVRYTNPELVQPFMDRGQPVLITTSHQANWEWLPGASALNGFPSDSVYKPLSNAFFEQLMQQVRARYGVTLVPMLRLSRSIVSRRAEPRLIGLVADQIPDRPEYAFWTDFLHQDTPFYPGPERLARSGQMPVVYVEMARVRRGYYEATFTLLGQPPYDDLPEHTLMTRYRDALEATIRQHPADWLWSHKRWKHQREQYREMWGRRKNYEL